MVGEFHSQVHFAVVLLSPDDVAYPRDAKPEEVRYRARQNVIFELGYFVGKLGRERVLVLYRKDDSFEMPFILVCSSFHLIMQAAGSLI